MNSSTTVYAIKSTNSKVIIQTNNNVRRFSTESILEEFPNTSFNFYPIPDNYDIILVDKLTNLSISPIINNNNNEVKRAYQLPPSPQLSSSALIDCSSSPPSLASSTYERDASSTKIDHIPRPQNKFILFSNQVRAKIQNEYPQEPNKLISKRIGQLWKSLSLDEQNEYANLAKLVANKHDEQHPDYKYMPKKRKKKSME